MANKLQKEHYNGVDPLSSCDAEWAYKHLVAAGSVDGDKKELARVLDAVYRGGQENVMGNVRAALKSAEDEI